MLRRAQNGPRRAIRARGPLMLLACIVAIACWGCSRDSSTANIRGMYPIDVPDDGVPWNVVFITVDTLRADALGVYGNGRPGITPTLDALAAKSFVFERAYSTSSWTRPAIASLLTGKHPTELGIMSEGGKHRLSEHATTLPELFADLGYETAGWYTNPHFKFGMEQGFRERNYRPTDDAEKVYDEVVSWVTQQAQSRYFLLVHTVDPHDVYKHHEEFPFAPQKSKMRTVAYLFPKSGSGIGGSCSNRDKARALSDEELAEMRACYDQEVAFTDRQIGRLVDALEETGQMDRTIIVFSADHGEEFRDHGSYWHGCTLYDELVRVPLLIYVPGTMGRRIQAPVSIVDLYPTLVDLITPPALEEIDVSGRSLRPLLEVAPWKSPPVYATTEFRGPLRQMVILGDRKLVSSPSATDIEAYDLGRDPKETKNLFE